MTERIKQQLIHRLPLLVCIVGILAVSVYGMRQYRQSVYEHISGICRIMTEKYPESERQVLAAVKEYAAMTEQERSGNPFLDQYGYGSSDFCRESEEGFFKLAVGSLLLAVSGSFLFSVKYTDRRVRKRVVELTDYLETVNTGADGTVIQIREDEFSCLQDEIYKTVTQLYQTREAAVNAKKNYGDNLANIAHQLKTPVTAAALSLQLLKKAAPDSCVGYGEQIKRQMERLEDLGGALLTLSQIDAGVLPLECAAVDIYTALNLAAENLSELAVKKDVSIEISEAGCVEITGDLEWTMEALLNLIKNCMEHSPQGGRVHCAYSGNPIYAEIRIWDEGEGFCPEDIPCLFERFYRGKRAAGNGIGIGLSMARSIFELQNGNVTARNLPHGGACFEVRVYCH